MPPDSALKSSTSKKEKRKIRGMAFDFVPLRNRYHRESPQAFEPAETK